MTRIGLIFLWILLNQPQTCFCNNTPTATKADQKLVVSSEIDRAFLTIGDRAIYQVSAKHPPEIKILDIDTQETLHDFEIKEEKKFNETLEDGRVSEGKTVTITNFAIGEFVLPPATITYEDRLSNKQKILSNKLYVSVESVDKKGEADNDIRGVKGVLGFRNKGFIFLIGFLVISLAGGTVWWLYRQKKLQLTAGDTHAPLLAPHEEAYQELNRLIDSDLLKRGQYKLYFSRISEILRRYFERRYKMIALEATTLELIVKLRTLELDSNIQLLIKKVLEFCDLVKFAKYLPGPTEVLEANREAKEIINLTKEPESMTPLPMKQKTESSSTAGGAETA